ncbi:MAG: hypothetical protein R3245_04210 [Kiloniellales bacterium]|nr:hypothetical protein [Kiloniellales bacterium]
MTWFFAGLFLLFGLPLAVTEDPDWARFWAGMSMLSLGAFALSMVRDALITGQIQFYHSTIRYASRPWLFWAAVAVITAAGFGVLIAGVWILFFKT